MLWLFGQIWIWLLISFTLGAVVTGYLLPWLKRPRTAGQAPPATAAEQTRPVETAGYQPEPAHPSRTPDERPSELPETGHSEGTLAPVEWPTDQPNEENGSTEEPAWPKEDWPAAEQPPGGGR